MALELDRMALDDIGTNPARLAEAIHWQLGERRGAIPVIAIAKALDVIEIKIEPLRNIEGVLLTTPERNFGSILLNRRSTDRRRRFTAAHELLHFLNPLHRPTAENGFWCSREDMVVRHARSEDWQRRQEVEANTFAIELLAPLKIVQRYLDDRPNLLPVLALSDDLNISREAAARRYVACHTETLAVAFSKESRFLYADWAKEFPSLALRKGGTMPDIPSAATGNGVSEIEPADAGDWLTSPGEAVLTVQTLHQRDGYATTLLNLVSSDDENAGIDDTYERFHRLFG